MIPTDDGSPEAAGRISQHYRDEWWRAQYILRDHRGDLSDFHALFGAAEEACRLKDQWSDEELGRLKRKLAWAQKQLIEGVSL